MKKLTGLLLPVLMIAACTSNHTGKTLPIYGEREPVTKALNSQQVTDTVYHTIPAFKFINQFGDSITDKSLNGKIYVADFFFTSCPSICPIMHRNMLNVYNAFKDEKDINIISFSIDPKHDSVAVLKKYADGLGISGNSWWLLQGDKMATYDLSKSFLVTTPKEDEKEKFIHDGYFILIDKQKRIRGSYDGTNEEQVKQLIEDIKTLKAEPAETAK
ncbi:SCO family protein [Mucilaginibacter limnophilus]|uniref:SCO family protein n=1 Tax=Mucilaginibacter limnophilus TaxID=1932778 RepID=A0A3S2UNP0_9SPHI|nr:SCO family protein [Mucilaginibacter limnophilus]RVU00591.1 SCO family protein [Mucilaginibacter limnophilus]